MSEVSASYMEDMHRQSHQMALRISQAFPDLVEGAGATDFRLEFLDQESLPGSPIAATVYGEDGRLDRIRLNKTTLEDQYSRLGDKLSFQELVSINVGIGVCMDLFYRQIADSKEASKNVTSFMLDYLSNPETVKQSILKVDNNFGINGHINRACEMITRHGKDAPDRVVRLNAQRLAFGMVMITEQMYDGELGVRASVAVRDDIRDQLGTDAGKRVFLGLAITGDTNASLKVAADGILEARDLPLAIPASRDEVNEFISLIRHAKDNEAYSEPELVELSDGYEVSPAMPDELDYPGEY